MGIASQIIYWVPFIGTAAIFLLLGIFYLRKNNFEKRLNLFYWIAIGLFVFSWLSQVLFYYFAVKYSALSEYLNQTGFFKDKFIALSENFLITLACAALIYLALVYVRKQQKAEMIESYFPKLLFLLVLLISYPNILPMLILAVIGATLFQLYKTIRHKAERISLVPFVIFSSLLIQILTLFPFYSDILIKLRLL